MKAEQWGLPLALLPGPQHCPVFAYSKQNWMEKIKYTSPFLRKFYKWSQTAVTKAPGMDGYVLLYLYNWNWVASSPGPTQLSVAEKLGGAWEQG